MSENAPCYAPSRCAPLDRLIRTKRDHPLQSVEELVADTFEDDEELDEFLAFTHSERHNIPS
ncbi:hypothetical protein [Actinomadura hibisca]|uniref:hypothetical protein n=1 Tax=Actinomadura hibisca TaxID=68565 RepID=UPI000ABAC889|nr:hypothetical protein [Actinomadura hibisca]